MKNIRFMPPLNLDRAMYLDDSTTGKPCSNTDAKYFYGSRLDFRGLRTMASPLSVVSPVISPMSAPPRPSGTEPSSLHFARKKNQNHTMKIWKVFTRKAKVPDNSRSAKIPSKSTTASDNVPVKKHKSTSDLRESRIKYIEDVNANPCYPPRHGFPPAPPTASSAAASFIHSSSEADVTNHPRIIFVIDDNLDMLSADCPLQRVKQTLPMDITDEEISECSSHPNTYSQPIPQHHPIRGQRRRAETSNSSRFKKFRHDPDASFLDMETKSKPFWI